MATSKPSLHIETFALGDFMTNCYVLHGTRPEPGDPCVIIDSGFSPERAIEYIRKAGLVPHQIWLTHSHMDHIGGLEALRSLWPDLPILIHEAEAEYLENANLNLSAYVLDEPLQAPPSSSTFKDGQRLVMGLWNFEVRHTPGHSPGGSCFYQPDEAVVFVGDALFAGSIGRTDFPGCDHATLLVSIRQQLLTLPAATRVFSGHGPSTTIGQESASNPFLSA